MVTMPMSTRSIDHVRDLTPEQRRRRVAEILAAGVVRWKRTSQLRSQIPSQFGHTSLEVSQETRLPVTVGFELRDHECEVNDG
jgi:hypothetical protein